MCTLFIHRLLMEFYTKDEIIWNRQGVRGKYALDEKLNKLNSLAISLYYSVKFHISVSDAYRM